MNRLNVLTIIGAVIVISINLVAIFAPIISPYDPNLINVEIALEGPRAGHIFGTDSLGRDLFSRMVFGARISLFVGIIAVGISVLIGLIVGSIAGYFGGRLDSLLMRLVDIMLCFPSFFLILSVIALLEPSLMHIMVVIGVTNWMGVARLVRAEILSLKERGFIEAAKALGASHLRIIVIHLLPNAMGPVLVNATLGVAGAIMIESGLSFLGVGVQPPTPSWGNILIEGKATLGTAWWITLFPGLAILVTVLGYNLLGEGLREYFSIYKQQS